MCTSFALVAQACGAKTSAVVMTTLASFGLVAFLLTTKQDEPHFSQYTAALFGIVYCGALPAFWVKLRALTYSNQALRNIAAQASGSKFVEAWPQILGGPEAWTTGLIVTVITVSCIIASDVGAYAFGKTFGKTQMIKISPNKTVEGALGGLLCTTLTAFMLRQLFGWHAGVIQTLVLGALVFFRVRRGRLDGISHETERGNERQRGHHPRPRRVFRPLRLVHVHRNIGLLLHRHGDAVLVRGDGAVKSPKRPAVFELKAHVII